MWHFLVFLLSLQDKLIGMVIVPPGGKDLASNWACHARGLAGVFNTIVVVDPSDASLANQLAVMGHAVHVLGGESPWPGLGEKMRGWKLWSKEHIELLLGVLSKGLDVLLSSAESVWTADATHVASALLPPEYDMGVALHNDEGLASAALFIRASQESVNWCKQLLVVWEEKMKDGKQSADAADFPVEGLKVTKLKYLSEFEHGNVAATSALPIIIPSVSRGVSKTAWLQSKRLWVIDDLDSGCTIQHCKRS